jgi:NTE family protein
VYILFYRGKMDYRKYYHNRYHRRRDDRTGVSVLYMIFRRTLLVYTAASLVMVFAQPPQPRPAKIGLVLSGGGALGLAHIGVLKVLERENIPISFISANSMGSIIGGLYAAGYSPAEIESIAIDLDWRNLLSAGTAFGSQYLPERQQSHKYIFKLAHRNFYPIVPSEIISLQKVEFLLIRLFAEKEYNAQYNFDSLAIPLRIIAVDLNTGSRVVLKQGSLEKAIRGSIAIPGVFAPEEMADKTLIDGGVLQYLPVDPIIDFDPDIIIASLTVQYDAKPGISLVDVISRTTSMVGVDNIKQQKKLADIVIEPMLTGFDATDYSTVRELILAGEQATEDALPAIKELLRNRTAVSTYRPMISRPPPYIDTICFEGLTITKPPTVIKIIKTRPKSSLDFHQLSRDLETLFNTGFFNTVNYRIESVSADTVNLVFELEETDYGSYYLGLRYDNDDNAAIGIEIGQRNLYGSGIGVRAVITLGDPNEYRAGLTNIRLHTVPFSFRLDCFWNSIDRSYYEDNVWLADYNVDNRGTLIELGQNIGRDAFFLIGFTAHQSKYRLPALAVFDTLPSAEWIIGPTFSWEINTHDDLHMPSRGASVRVTAIYAHERLGGRSSFLRVRCTSRQLIPLTTWLLCNSYFDIGHSSGESPWSYRFYTGGDDCIGYRTETFTTTNKTLVHAGFDIRILSALGVSDLPLFLQLFAAAVSFVPPADYLRGENIDLDDFHLCFGAGVRMNTPIGPLCLKAGFADLHERAANEDIQSAIYLSIGRDFRYVQ